MATLATIFTAGASGEGVLVVLITGERIVGADLSGVTIDGSLVASEYETKLYAKLTVPEGVHVVQGVTAPKDGLSYEVSASLPPDVFSEDYVTIETPHGPVNARFVKLRDFE